MEVETKNLQVDFSSVATGRIKNTGREVRQSQPAEHQLTTGELLPEERKRQIEKLLDDFGQHDQVTMRYDNEIDRVVVTVTDGETNEVVRQIPPKHLISFLRNFDKLVGLMVDRRV